MKIRYAMQNPNYEIVMQRSMNACPLAPRTAKPSSEYEVMCAPTFSLQAICIFIVYILRIPQNMIPIAPPTIPTVYMAAGVAKMPIPIKHLSILK